MGWERWKRKIIQSHWNMNFAKFEKNQWFCTEKKWNQDWKCSWVFFYGLLLMSINSKIDHDKMREGELSERKK
jgi:hypothetical protein